MWRSKRNAAASSAGDAPFDRSRRKSCADDSVCKIQAKGRLRKFFGTIGSSIESLIDATPLGVPTPCEPWSPLTDKKKALLSNPISVLKVITEIMSAYSPSKFINSLEAAVGEPIAHWLQVSAIMLMGLRESLANAILGEDTNSISDPPVVVLSQDVHVLGEDACGSFVDLSTENSTKMGTSKGLLNFLTRRVILFIDSLTLLAHGIVVTSDDCSVECSLASLLDECECRISSPSSMPESCSSDEDDFEDCPSVVTEIALMEELDDDDDDDGSLNDTMNCNLHLIVGGKDDDEYVITDVSDTINDDDFVDVCADIDFPIHK